MINRYITEMNSCLQVSIHREKSLIFNNNNLVLNKKPQPGPRLIKKWDPITTA